LTNYANFFVEVIKNLKLISKAKINKTKSCLGNQQLLFLVKDFKVLPPWDTRKFKLLSFRVVLQSFVVSKNE
jgi:hypothetical protein